MELLEVIVVVVVLLVGIVIGVDVGKEMKNKETSKNIMGWLRIDHSEPDEPTRMFVELRAVTPDMIAQHKFVTFEVINESYISHN